MAGRIIIHCDLDAFFAAVETLHHNLDPNVPLILGSDPKEGKGRGIVSTCNYAARAYGIRSAMPIGEAWRRCPGPPHGPGHYLKSTRGLYSRASRKVMSILSDYADKFEQASIDEAYLDVTEYCDGDWDKSLALASELQAEISEKLGLSTSFGIGPTRILAKMGSEENKPGGIHRTMPDEIESFFAGRSVREVPGIGPKTATRLAEWGINSMSEVAECGEIALARFTSERFASWIFCVLDGTTSDEISPLRSRKSVGKETTFEVDQIDVALDMIQERVELAAVTLGSEGSLLITPQERITIDADPVARVVDKTGAGDLYAAGVLYGLAQGYDLQRCGMLGSIAAEEVIGHVGPRPEVSLRELAGELA